MYKIDAVIAAKNEALGDMPNIKMPTMGGEVFWDTKKTSDDYKLQVHRITGHARILDSDDYRVAWGDYNTMLKKFKILNTNESIVAGDIIGVKRAQGAYEHYAVYIGNYEVIHYAARNGDFGDNICIHKAPMKDFLKGSKKFFVLVFPDKHGRPKKISIPASTIGTTFFDINIIDKILNLPEYKLYSAKETVRRAKSRLGESEYNLLSNNCEHFAIWCKTGISESHQVKSLLASINPMKVSIV